MNIFETLRDDHQKQRTLVELLCKTHGDSHGRRELLQRLKSALQTHAAAEERNLYALLLKDDRSQQQARHSIAEHQELDDLLDKLETTDMSSSGWLSIANELRERLLHHLKEEETKFFQMAGKVLSEEKKGQLAEQYRTQIAQG